MEKQGITLEDEVIISERVSMLKYQSPDISGVYYEEGEVVTVQDLITLSLVYSDNSAVIQLAEVASGSESAHVEKMNAQAAEWGLTNTHFVNVTGLTMRDYGVLQLPGVGVNDYNVSTAREVAAMSRNIIMEYPQMLAITSQSYIEFNGETLKNYNMMLEGLEEEYPGVTGFKTGSSDEAGSCFVGYYTYKDKSYISVVLGAETSNGRFTETKKMYNWIQGQLINTVISKENEFEVDIKGDTSLNSSLSPKYDVLSVDNGVNSQISSITYNSEYFDENNRLIKDIPIGETVVTITLQSLSSQDVTTVNGNAESFQIELVSKEEIKYQGKVLSLVGVGFEFISNLYNSILNF
jgi:D-alanyl-D-alanine carboxypeptidase